MFKFIEARWFTPVSVKRRVDFIVIHDMEMSERADTAEDCAHFFANLPSDRKASAHYCVDNDSIVQCVRENDIAYHAPPNTHSIGIEHAGFARQTRDQWLDDYGRQMLRRSADLMAELLDKYDLPSEFLGPQELRDGKRGITTHANVSKAWGQTSHTDPGPDFPIAWYMDRVRARRAQLTQEDIVTDEDINKIAEATADKLLSDAKATALRGRIREALDNELGDESGAGSFSDRVAAKVLAALPTPAPAAGAVDTEAVAEAVVDELAERVTE